MTQSKEDSMSNSNPVVKPKDNSLSTNKVSSRNMEASAWGSFSGSFFQASEINTEVQGGSTITTPEGIYDL